MRVSNTARNPSVSNYWKYPLIDDGNTVALWHFDDGVGSSAADSSGNGYTGTLYGPTWVKNNLNLWKPEWVDRYGEKALKFDGSDYIECCQRSHN